MTQTFKVPIRNLFCLLSYIDEMPEMIESFNDVDEDLITYDFLAKRFLHEVELIHRKGFIKNYTSHVEQTDKLAGKILINESMNLIMARRPTMFCEKDEYSINIPFNQVMKATLVMLSKHEKVTEDTRIRSFKWVERLFEVDDIHLSKHLFTRAVYHRNNMYYKRMMNIALLLYEMNLLSHKRGDNSLFNVEMDDSALNRLFEKFLLNFYRLEQEDYRVSVEEMKWNLEGNNSLLPIMRTDISLMHKYERRKIIMDAKYYANVFQEYYGKKSFHSGNLYQLFTYLMHQDEDLDLRGILIYPVNGIEVSEVYRWNERMSMEVYTVNLDDPWNQIYEKLKSIC